MKIFNEDLEKHLLFNNNSLLELKYVLSMSFMAILVAVSTAFSIMLIIKTFIDYYPKNLFFLVPMMILIFPLLFSFLMNKIDSYIKRKLTSAIPPFNPTLAKLKNAAKQKNCVNLVKLWKCFNPDHPSDSIALGQNQKDIELLQKLDDDLVHFIENADDATIKLFSLEDFESYKQLYMKYIAPKQKEEVLNKIQTLIENHGSNQENYLVQQLRSIKNEIEKYNTDTTDYFEFKKWHEDILDMLKLDKDNNMVKSNYQNIIQKINSSQKKD